MQDVRTHLAYSTPCYLWNAAASVSHLHSPPAIDRIMCLLARKNIWPKPPQEPVQPWFGITSSSAKWQVIVSELGTPSTCSPAKFTLKLSVRCSLHCFFALVNLEGLGVLDHRGLGLRTPSVQRCFGLGPPGFLEQPGSVIPFCRGRAEHSVFRRLYYASCVVG